MKNGNKRHWFSRLGGRALLASAALSLAAAAQAQVTVVSVEALDPPGSYSVGAEILICVTFSQNISLNGSTTGLTTPYPYLNLKIGPVTSPVQSATYIPGSLTADKMYFTYTVKPGEFAADLGYPDNRALKANGAFIEDAGGANPMSFIPTSVPEPGSANSLSGMSDIEIRTMSFAGPASVPLNETVNLTLSRGGFLGTALTINMTYPPEVTGLASVTIPANGDTVQVAVKGVSATLAPVIVKARPSGYPTNGVGDVTHAIEVDFSAISITGPTEVDHNSSVTLTLKRAAYFSVAMTANLDYPAQLSGPSTVTIDAGSESKTFDVTGVTPTTVPVTFTAHPNGYPSNGSADATYAMEVIGLPPYLTLEGGLTQLSEGIGGAYPYETTWTVRRWSGANTQPLDVMLVATNPLAPDVTNAVAFPATVRIPAGTNSYTFPIMAKDGTFTARIEASATNYLATTREITVENNDPTILSASVSPLIVAVGSPVSAIFSATDVLADAASLRGKWVWDALTQESTTNALSGSTTPHTYTLPGTYTVSLYVSDKDGGVKKYPTDWTVTVAPMPYLDVSGGVGQIAEGPGGTYTESTTWTIRRWGAGATGSALPVVLTVSAPGAISVPTSATIPSGQSSVDVVVYGRNGSANVTVTFTATGYTPVTREIGVANIPPTITGASVSPLTPLINEFVHARYSASDVPADMPNISGTWIWGDGTETGGALNNTTTTHTYTEAGNYTITLYVTDGDDDVQFATTWEVTVNPGYALNVMIPANGANGLQGVGTGHITFNPTPSRTNDLTGNFVSVQYRETVTSVSLTAWPDQPDVAGYNSYHYQFISDAIPENLAEPLAFGASGASATVAVRMGEDRDITVWFSREWMQGDNRGDIDNDGLSDEWEIQWELDPLSAAGVNGGGGCPSGDLMPNAANVILNPLILDPSGQPAGGPFGYPIDWAVNWTGYAPVGPSFNNRLQFRGQTLDIWDADRPLTDPTVADTSTDGLSDGWLYYFYANGVNNSNFVGRAYDPTTLTGSLVIPNTDIVYYFNPAYNRGLAGEDLDGDGLTTLEEYYLGTNPIDWDTDGDGLPDGWEILYGLDPLDLRDADQNPDQDYMAVDGDGRIHADVYAEHGFDPRTGWAPQILGVNLTWVGASPNTRPYNNIDEFMVMRWRMDISQATATPILAITPLQWSDWCTDPLSPDTDFDGVADGWELYVGLNPSYPDGTADGDADNEPDDLSNIGEFSCQGAALFYDEARMQQILDLVEQRRLGSVHVFEHQQPGWLESQQRDPFVLAPNHFAMVDPGWLNKFWPTDPNDSDTDRDQMPDGAEAQAFRYDVADVSGVLAGRCFVGGGLNPTSADTDGDYLPDYWENCYPGGAPTAEGVRTGMDGTYGDAMDDYDGDGLLNFQEYLVGAVFHFNYDKWQPGLGYNGYDPVQFFLPARDYGPGNYGETPYEWDWACWEGSVRFFYQLAELRPESLLYATTDPTNWDTDFDGMDDYYELYHGLNPLWSLTVDIVAHGYPTPIIRDARIHPWQVGDELADPDQDGLPNWEEALNPNRVPPQPHHTDPTPYWFTDMSYSESFVNLYYQFKLLARGWRVGGPPSAFYWGDRINPPSYMFSFESNEGFDTDNDNLPDKRELIGGETPGLTDPLDFSDPYYRTALYLDGDAAARTRGGFFHGGEALRTWAVELWFKPEQVATGARQILIERPVPFERGDPLPITENIRRNFRLGIDEDGRLFVEYDNDGNDLLTRRAKADQVLLTDGKWYHVAGVFDGTQLKLYIDGQLHGTKLTAVLPATGVIYSSPDKYMTAPIVVGAADSAPYGVVNGGARYYNISTFIPPTQPQLHSFFKGWVDEIRIWNGPRSEAQIKATMTLAIRPDDVVADTNEFANLFYHYSFSNLPDPSFDPIVPEGFASLNGRPNDGSYPGIPWWRHAADRSTVYNNYLYVPWIENTIAHVPIDPPLDSVMMSNAWATIVTTNNGVVTSNYTQTADFPNTANPYGHGYSFALSRGTERNPELGEPIASMAFDPAVNRLYNDLLPLRNARADRSVDLWDGDGPGVATDTDSNGDGIANWWYVRYGYDPFGPSIADEDPDGDGISNYWEYRLSSDPMSSYSLDPTRTVSDGKWDSDGDGLTNYDEVMIYGTDPTTPDTDDDGITDGIEVSTGTSPVNPYDPEQLGVASFNGNGRLLVKSETVRDQHNRWTVEAWVKADTQTVSGIIIRRGETVPKYGVTAVDYELGVDQGVPYVTYTFRQGTVEVTERIQGFETIGTNWVHLAGVLDDSDNQLRLYVDAKRVAYKRPVTLVAQPLSVNVETTIGGGALSGGVVTNGFTGEIDAVRIWDYPRRGIEIQLTRDELLPEFNGLDPDTIRAPVRLFNFDTRGIYAHNSRYPNDWLTSWKNVGELQGDAVIIDESFPPINLDSDDDGLSDVSERVEGTLEHRSESPLVYRALTFDGSPDSVVEVDELVDSAQTGQFALDAWTVETWVRPTQVPTGRASLVRRLGGIDQQVTFELGLVTVAGEAHPYARFQRRDSGANFVALEHETGVSVGTDSADWTHLAATYAPTATEGEYEFILFVNGSMVETRRLTQVLPAVGNGGVLYLGATNFVGQMHETRIWRVPRRADEIRQLYDQILVVSGGKIDNSFQAGATHLGRITLREEDGLVYTNLTAFQRTHKFSMMAWVKMEAGVPGGIVAERKSETLSPEGIQQWTISHSLRVSADGQPEVYWEGVVNVHHEDPATIYDWTALDNRNMQSEVDIRDGTWHHLAAIGDGRRISLYIDGIQDRTAVRYFAELPVPYGTIYDTAVAYQTYMPLESELRVAEGGIQAVVDEVMFWNEDLTPNQIVKFMNNGLDVVEIENGLAEIVPLPAGAVDPGAPRQRLVSYVTFDGSQNIPFITDRVSAILYRILPKPSGLELLNGSRPPVALDVQKTWFGILSGYFPAVDGGKHIENYVQRNHYGHAGLLRGSVQFEDLSVADTAHFVTDSNQDGIPDGWYIQYGLAPGGDSVADDDWDYDGVSNYYEWLFGTNPLRGDTDGNGVLDGDEDSDGDGLSNLDEILLHGTDPSNPDTDDDGFSDGDEINMAIACDGRLVTSPFDSLSPLVPRSMVLDGSVTVVPSVVRGMADRFNLKAWTIDCQVKPASATETGTLLARTTATGRTTFALRLQNNEPVLEFTTATGVRIFAGGVGNPIQAGEWSRLTGVWDPDAKTLALFVNGVSYMAQASVEACATGSGMTVIGGGVQGWIDEIKVYAKALPISRPGLPTTLSVTGGVGAPALWDAFLGEAVPAGVSDLTVDFSGAVEAAGVYQNFPMLPHAMPTPANGIILASGRVEDAASDNLSSGISTAFGTPGDFDLDVLLDIPTRDAAALTISFSTDDTVNGVSFNLLFASDEFPEFVGDFNDGFAAFLDGTNISFDAQGQPLTVNNNFFELDADPWHPGYPAKEGKLPVSLPIEYDGLTSLLVTSKALPPGQHTLKFVIADALDEVFDSAIFLSNFRFSMIATEGTGKAQEEEALTAFYRFDDGGITAEDFVHTLDWAYALKGVTMTNAEFGVSSAVADANDNGISDWWEMMWFGGYVDADGDPDGDGLTNVHEYWCDTNPLDSDSDNNGILDGDEDSDGDGLPNRFELAYGTLPHVADTDDDGLTDGEEYDRGTDPTDSTSPGMQRVLALDGSGYLTIPLGTSPTRLALSSYTVEAWVRLNAGAGAGTVIRRQVGVGQQNVWLGVEAAVGGKHLPYARVTPVTDTTHTGANDKTARAAAGLGLEPETWYHLAATFDEASGLLLLYVNGVRQADTVLVGGVMTHGVGPQISRVGEGWDGCIDEVRVWDRVRTADAIHQGMFSRVDMTLPGGFTVTETSEAMAAYRLAVAGGDVTAQAPVISGVPFGGLALYYRFDDGGETAEDFTTSEDWLLNWANAGVLHGGTTMTETFPGIVPLFGYDEDLNNDLIPDAWQRLHWPNFDPTLPGDWSAHADPDGDGLSNLYEYLAGTHPLRRDSDDNGVWDGDEDSDGDGLSNIDEQEWGTDPGNPDSDYDGQTDKFELTDGPWSPWSSPLYSMGSFDRVDRSLDISVLPLGGIEMPQVAADAVIPLSDWTVEAWVLATDATQSGYLVRKLGGINEAFVLGLDGGVPYVRYQTLRGKTVRLDAPAAAQIQSGDWTHLAATWNAAERELTLMVDVLAVFRLSLADHPLYTEEDLPVTGYGPLMIGRSTAGWVADTLLDNVRVWNTALTQLELDEGTYQLISAGSDVRLMRDYRFDDGGPLAEDFAHPGDWHYAITAVDYGVGTNAAGHALWLSTTAQAFPGIDDSSGNGLPDWWQSLHNVSDASGDEDSDGLVDLYEYWGRTNPNKADTYSDGTDDGERSDGFGLTLEENQWFGTDPRVADTDGDGLTDVLEIKGNPADQWPDYRWPVSDPCIPLQNTVTLPAPQERSQVEMRSATFDGVSRILLPSLAKYAMPGWTLGAWVNPESVSGRHVIIRRAVAALGGAETLNYELGIQNLGGKAMPYVRYVLTNGTEKIVGGAAGDNVSGDIAIPLDAWTHLTGTFNEMTGVAQLYINGMPVGSNHVSVARHYPPTTGSQAANIETTIGGGADAGGVQNGFIGTIDEVTFSYGATAPAAIYARYRSADIEMTGAFTAASTAQPPREGPQISVTKALEKPRNEGRLLVRFKPGVSALAGQQVHEQIGARLAKGYTLVPVQQIEVDEAEMTEVLTAYRAREEVLYAEPDYIVTASDLIPNDPDFGLLWGMRNTGQFGGLPGADISAPTAWDQGVGSRNIIVAVIDTGVDYTHPDLADNMWVNPGEIPGNGIDDDGNGFVDDVYGYNFSADHGSPMDDAGHGTHVAGTIGAIGNNAVGVAGVNWNVRIMALKFLDETGVGYTTDAIAALEYAVRMGAQISNNSWGGGGYSQALYDMIEAAMLANHLFVASSGNEANDNDGSWPAYPASYDLDNVISVGASTDLDQLAYFSNYGLTSVDLVAPGMDIYSTLPGGMYGFYSGTSMACPHVAGAAALVLSRRPGLSYAGVRNAILGSVDKVAAFDGVVATGGRLNVAAATTGGGTGTYIAYFRFEDDGGRALDYTRPNDLLLNWHHAGQLEGALIDAATYYHLPGDVNDNQMPDWFEAAYGVSDPLGDPDGDGLNNLYESLSGSNPWLDNSDNMGASDAFEPAVAGFSNLDAQKMGSHPDLADTDDDGRSDALEYAELTNLTLSMEPYTDRVLSLDGAADPVLLANQPRFALGDSWTVEGRVKVSTNQLGAFQIITRAVGAMGVNYELGVNAALQPYVAFSDTDGNRRIATSLISITAGRWFHLAGVWDDTEGELHIVLDGRLQNTAVVDAVRPAATEAGVSRGVLGNGLYGCLDEVTVWSRVRTPAVIYAGMRKHLTGGESGLIAYYRFDDATSGTVGGGVSGRADWATGHIEDFVLSYRRDWLNEWYHAATIVSLGLVTSPPYEGLTLPEKDNDDDGIPDWWELYYFGNLSATDGNGDADGDGLNDRNEYMAGTDPTRTHSFGGMTSDADIDSDGDGLTNMEEQNDYGTNPGKNDTDDDGVSDGTEVLYSTSPVHPMSVFSIDPILMNMAARRSLDMGHAEMPSVGIELSAFETRTAVDAFGTETLFEANRFAFGDTGWTVEAWINQQSDLNGAIYTYEAIAGNSIFFGLTNGAPYGMILKGDGSPLIEVGGVIRPSTNGTLVGASPLQVGRWTHLALTWSPDDNSFSILQDGVLYFAQTSFARPVIGNGRAFIGQGFTDGYLDEVRVWNIVRRQTEIKDWYQKLFPAPGYVVPAPDGEVPAHVGPYRSDYTKIRNDIDELPSWRESYLYGQPLVAYYRFDDGGSQIEDFAKLGDDRYALNGPVTTAEAASLYGWDDADGDGLPEWWINMYNLDEWPVQHIGPYHVLDPRPSVGSDYPVTYSQGWVTPVGVVGLARGLYYNTDWTTDEYGVMIETFNVWRDVNPDHTNATAGGAAPTNAPAGPDDGLGGTYRGRGEYNEEWDIPAYADYGVWFTDDGTLGYTGMFFNDVDDDLMYSAGEDIWLELWNPDAAEDPQFDLREIVGVNYFRTFIAYGSVGDHTGWTWVDPGNTNNAPEINWYVDTKSTSVGRDGLYSCFTKYVHLNNEPRKANLVLSLFGTLDHTLYINGNEYDPDSDPDRSVLVSLLKRGRNQIYLYTENETVITLIERDYHYTRDYNRDFAGVKFDMSLRVNDVDLIVRGDTSVVDPRAVWHGQAWSRYYHLNFVNPLPDQSGRLVYHQDFSIANDAEIEQTGLVTGDGLDNYTEILVGTNPRDFDSNNNGLPDTYEDFDGDGLSNIDEQLSGSHPALPDTDDNGIRDGDDPEPASSLMPLADRALNVTGGYVEMPYQSRFALASWTVQAWVKPSAVGANGTLVARTIASSIHNYRLELNNGLPTARFTPADHTADVTVVAPAVEEVQANVWTHLAASFDDASGRLSLFVDGRHVATTVTVKHAAFTGFGSVATRAGQGFAGLIDEVAIFATELNEGDVSLLKGGVGYYIDSYPKLVSYYRFDDGTSAVGPDNKGRHVGTSGLASWWIGQVEEFASGFESDWLQDWRNSGTLVGSVLLVETDTPVSFATGEVYTDYDYTEDWWELLFGLPYAGIDRYDSHTDPDGDGWDNWSEARYSAWTNVVYAAAPNTAVTAPLPEVTFTFRYDGARNDGPVVVLAYNSQTMNGTPNATFQFAAPTLPVTTVTTHDATLGRLRQGNNWFFAFIDRNGNGAWDEGEPAGLSERFPYQVGWHKNAVAFTLTDGPVNGFVRLTWPADPLKNSYVVSIRRMTYSDSNTFSYVTVFAKAIAAPRNWIHEGDILDGSGTFGGGNPGLDWGGVITGTPDIPIGAVSTYDFRVDNVTVGLPFQIYYAPGRLDTPVPVSPVGGMIQHRPRPEFRWTMTTRASAFAVEIAPLDTTVAVYSSGVIAAPPPQNIDGLRVWSPPIHWGDILPSGALTNAMYRWRVRALQPRDPNGAFGFSPSDASAYALVEVGLNSVSSDSGSIQVPLNALYLPPSNAVLRVQAFESAAFNDVPVAQKTLFGATSLPQTVILNGLDVGRPYYIAAYIDQNNNNRHDIWESWGYHRSRIINPTWHYQPVAVMAAKKPQVPEALVMILHVDSDQDKIPDTYEYVTHGTLVLAPTGGEPSALSWLAVSGLISSDPARFVWTDTSGDGIDDMQAYVLGLDARQANTLHITGLAGDTVSWALTAPDGNNNAPTGVYGTLVEPPAADRFNVAVRYVMERSDSLSDPVWEVVHEVTTDLKFGAYDIGADMQTRPAGFYRIRMVLPE